MSSGDGPTFVGSRQSAGFGSLLLLAMAVSTATASTLGIVATFVIDDLDIDREQLGWVVTAIIVGAGLLSPYAGKLTDRIGGKSAFQGLFVASAASFLFMAVAPVYAAMFLGAAFGAVAQAGGNPSTNKLIALHVPAGSRGVVTGIKQSGVQLGIFLGGLLLPFIAEAIGWRWALGLVSLVAIALLVPASLFVPRDRPDHGAGVAVGDGPLPRSIYWLAVYGFLLGFGGSVTFFLALYVEESLGRSPRLGGLAVGLAGLTAIFGRIAWARFAERLGRFVMPLTAIAVLSVVASVALLAATNAIVLLWVGVILTGLSSSSWNSVGMLAVMDEAGMERAGRASGIVMLGFLIGLGIGPPLFGRSIDSTGSYDFMWMVSIGTFLLASGVALLWSRFAPHN